LEAALTIGGECINGAKVVALQIREVGEDFILTHTSRQGGEHIINRDAHPSNARLAASLAGLGGDPLAVIDACSYDDVSRVANLGGGRTSQFLANVSRAQI
jgi:hypothetical protein